MLGGKPFLAYFNHGAGGLQMFDLSDPLAPRLALTYPAPGQPNLLAGWIYSTICFSKDGAIVGGNQTTLQFQHIAFIGLDAAGNPQFDFAHPVKTGFAQDPSPRGMASVDANASDPATGDIYYLATTSLYNKMVPGWGADGTGVGESTTDGKPLWFSRSSGGNYMSIDCVNDGKNALILACKSFGGQIDLFDSSGLRPHHRHLGVPL